jgi:hypothetical protein
MGKPFITFLSFITLASATPAAMIPPKAVALAAQEKSRAQLKSGIGEGVFEMTGPGEKPTRYSLKVVHAGEKFRAELAYLDGEALTDLPNRLVVIYDGETLAYREVSPKFRPFGEEARLFKAKPTEIGRSGPFFRFNPANLLALDLPAYLRNRPETVFVYTPKDVFASLETKKPSVSYELRFPKTAGYNIGSYEVRATESGYKQATIAGWDRSENIWYVREFEKQTLLKDKPSRYEKMTYKSYEANPKVDKSQFRLPALGLKADARLLYLDFETKGIDSYTNTPAPPEEANDTLMDGLKRLTLRDSVRPPQKDNQ